MISILAQERLLGFTLGTALAGFVVFDQRNRIRHSIAANQLLSDAHTTSQLVEPIFGKQFRSNFVQLWNKAVDQTLGPVVASLSSHKR